VAKPRHVACSNGGVRNLLTLLLLCVCPASAAAQTLVVRTSAEAHPAIEGAVEDGLRESLGASVRRVDSPLDELALAAGCTEADPGSAQCIATIARAAGVRLVAIERLTREGAEWRVSIDLRRADGTQVSVLTALCDDASCAAEAMAGASGGPEEAPSSHDAATRASTDDRQLPDAAPSSSSTEIPPTSHSIAVIPHVLFIGATLLGVTSAVLGGLSIAAADEATHMGTLRNTTQVDHEHALEEQSAVMLGVGIALATCGAGLAIAGVFTLADDHGPRLRVGVGNVGLTVSF
jgi:hypothetical protein